jgi:mRNA turnover protein 4
MPKSRRAKVAPLTKVKAKGKEHKDALIEQIHTALEKYQYVYTFSIENLRTNILQQVREDRRDDSRLYLGNNKVMMVALGRDEEESVQPNLWKLCKFLVGLSGLLFTNLPKKEVKDYFATVGGSVYARTGSAATINFALPAGPLPQFPHSMYDQLTKLGLPLKLDKGVITVLADTVVCNEGDELTAEAAQLLKLFNMQTAEMKIELTAVWSEGAARKLVA